VTVDRFCRIRPLGVTTLAYLRGLTRLSRPGPMKCVGQRSARCSGRVERWDWCRRCASTERVDRSGICGVGLELSLTVVLHVVFIRMRVVMDLQTVAAAGLGGSRDQATAPSVR
jgi:hypothetical protein